MGDAVGLAAGEELLAQRRHQRVHLLGDRLAQVVGLGGRESGQVLGDLHRLLLVDVDALGRLQDRLEPRIEVAHRLEAVLAPREHGDVGHRPRAVERDERDQVLELRRLDLAERVAHAARLELEDAERVAAREHVVGGLVVQRQAGEIAEVDTGRLADDADGLVDDVEVAQAQEVHLEQAERLDVAHRVLRHELGVGALLLQRQVLEQRAVADHDAGGVDRVGAHETLERPRHVDDLAHELVLVVGLAQLLVRLHRLLEADLHALGHELRDAVDGAVGQAHDAPGVAHRGLGGELRERDDLGDALAAVLLGHVGHHALAAVHREVDVDVGHRLAAGVQEALEEQVVAQRVEVGDAQRVGHDRAGRRAASRADGDAVGLGEAHEIPDDQEVVGEPHLADRLELELEAVADDLVERPVALGHALLADPAQHPERVVAGLVEARQVDAVEVEHDVAALGDLERRRQQAVAAPGRHRPAHLVGRLEVEVLGREAEALGVREEIVGLDAEQRLVRRRILGAQVVHVARADDRQPGVGGEREQAGIDAPVLVDAGVLQLDVDVLAPEDLHEAVELLPCARHVAGEQRRAGAPGEAARERDDAAGVGLEQLVVDARLVVVALEVAERAELDQVVVALGRLGQQREVVPVALARVHARAAVVDEVDLAAQQRLDAGLPGRAVELDRARHGAVVGDPDGGHAELDRPLDELGDAACAVQHRILGVDVQMGVTGHGRSHSRHSLGPGLQESGPPPSALHGALFYAAGGPSGGSTWCH